MWYLAWRTMLQLHNTINYSILVAGHTKFGPDRCFDIIKRAYEVTYISSLYELAKMVDSSSTIGVNKAQLVGKHDSRVIVLVYIYDWSNFLCHYFTKIPNVKKYKCTNTSGFLKMNLERFI